MTSRLPVFCFKSKYHVNTVHVFQKSFASYHLKKAAIAPITSFTLEPCFFCWTCRQLSEKIELNCFLFWSHLKAFRRFFAMHNHAIKSIKFFKKVGIVYKTCKLGSIFVDKKNQLCILKMYFTCRKWLMFPPMISKGLYPQQNSRDLSLPHPRLMCEISECGVRAHEGATEVPLGKGVEFFIEDVMTNRS